MLQAFIGSIKAYQVLNSGKNKFRAGLRELSWGQQGANMEYPHK